MNNIDKANKYIEKGNKKIKGNFFNFLTDKSIRYEEGLDLYKKAINIYKIEKKNIEAAKLYVICAKNYNEIKEYYDSSECYLNAANLFKKENIINLAIDNYKECIRMYQLNGKFGQSAKIFKILAEIYEKQEDYELSFCGYSKAFENFDLENYYNSEKINCKEKMAEIKLKNFDDNKNLSESIKCYEYILEEYLKNNLLKYNSKGYLIKIIFILLVWDDIIGAEKFLDKYRNKDLTLTNSNEFKALENLVLAKKNNNKESVEEACSSLEKNMVMDEIKASLILKLKDIKETTYKDDIENDLDANDDPF